ASYSANGTTLNPTMFQSRSLSGFNSIGQLAAQVTQQANLRRFPVVISAPFLERPASPTPLSHTLWRWGVSRPPSILPSACPAHPPEPNSNPRSRRELRRRIVLSSCSASRCQQADDYPSACLVNNHARAAPSTK